MYFSLNTQAVALSVPLDQALTLAREAGFAALDVPMQEVADIAARTSLDAVREQFLKASVLPGAWDLPLDFRHDERAYQEGLAQLPQLATMAQALGSTRCYTWLLPFSDELEYKANLMLHVQRLRPVAEMLASHGCRLALEFVGPSTLRRGHPCPFIHTIDGALDLAARLGTDNVGLLLDAFHWFTSGGTRQDIQRLRGDQVVHVHVNDGVAGRSADEQLDQERRLPGATGVIDSVEFFQDLASIGYDGPVVAEPFDATLAHYRAPERVRLVMASLEAARVAAGIPIAGRSQHATE